MVRKGESGEPSISFSSGGTYDTTTPKSKRDSMWKNFWAQLAPENRHKQVRYPSDTEKSPKGKKNKIKKPKNKKHRSGRGNR